MGNRSAEKWRLYYRDIGIPEDINEFYVSFVEDCLKNGVSPIFEYSHLSKLVGCEPTSLGSMIVNTKVYYREFRLKKRSGGVRKILAPYPSLLAVQRWINDNVLAGIKLRKCVTGFRRGVSIVDNATVHCGREEVVKYDIRDFFPSINFRRVMSVFLGVGYPPNVAYYLSKLCTLGDELPQGAATSPSISNIVCRRLDSRLFSLCRKSNLRYTRYADDITISGRSVSTGIDRLVQEIIEDEGFSLNREKHIRLAAGDRKIVTGLDISSGVPRVTREFRRELQKDVYFVWSAGLSAHVSRRRLFFPNYLDHLEGRLLFWESVEPRSTQAAKLRVRIEALKKQ